jgi:PIN domain nuclease of toxin-antitoxin system
MRLLLDTHVFAWALAHSARLSALVLDQITDPDNEVWVGAATIYELDYKRPSDRELAILPADLVAAGIRLGYAWLDITPEHARIAAGLDRNHKDPWDRLIAAQAIAEDLTVVSKDRALASLGARIVW